MSAKVSSVVVPGDILLEAIATKKIETDTVLIFWVADEEARKRGRHASRGMKVFSLDITNEWRVDKIDISPSVELDMKTNEAFSYGS